jgi:DNA invertase Pin-like site-specific DNA recombinase
VELFAVPRDEMPLRHGQRVGREPDAAIYARKSTEQTGADADAKSVARQIENAEAFIDARGWVADPGHVYFDDAVSGAETKRLVSRQRLLDLIASGRAPFQVLVMRDASRFSRRDGDEAFAELKAIAKPGITVWFHADGARFNYGTLADNVISFVRAEMAAEYRRQVSLWTKEALWRRPATATRASPKP